MTARPRCFIAMAFGRPDTDAFYRHLLRPGLQSLNVEPIIVKNRPSNAGLDQQIRHALDSCHFCIADLTYARQSVYWEAGYAEKSMPVVYTVRADHLDRARSDE